MPFTVPRNDSSEASIVRTPPYVVYSTFCLPTCIVNGLPLIYQSAFEATGTTPIASRNGRSPPLVEITVSRPSIRVALCMRMPSVAVGSITQTEIASRRISGGAGAGGGGGGGGGAT